jgi:predicted GNAT family acetyltransferase
MAISGEPLVAADPRLGLATSRHLDPYHAASLAMYTEEVGVAPMSPYDGYRSHVASLIKQGMAYCVLQKGQVVFKADVVASAGPICQIGGVWLAPAWRGLGYSEALMSAVVMACRNHHSTVSLYVNSYNRPAINCYRAVGFEQVSECATVLY